MTTQGIARPIRRALKRLEQPKVNRRQAVMQVEAALRRYRRRRGVRELARAAKMSSKTVSNFFRGRWGVVSHANAIRLLRLDLQ